MKKIKDPGLFACIKKFLTVYLPQVRNRSSNTSETYRFSINLYLLFLHEQKGKTLYEASISDFNQKNILLFMEWLQDVRHNEVSTVNQRLSNLRAFCSYLHKNGRVSHSDMAEISEIRKLADLRRQEVPFLPVEHMRLILQQPDTSRKTGLRDKFFLALLYDSGCRNQEILDLRVKDFVISHSGEAELHIIGKGRKYRVTPISKGVTKLFYDYCHIYHPRMTEAYENHLFYTVRNGVICPMSTDNVQRFLRGYEGSVRKMEPGLLHLHPHLFRHTRAMHLYMAGVPLPLIAEWLGHSRMETTQIYAQASIEMKRQASEKLAENDSSILKGDVAFKYADDEELLRKLSGLK